MLSLMNLYKELLSRRPIVTKSVTCGVLFLLGDYIAQKGKRCVIFSRVQDEEMLGL